MSGVNKAILVGNIGQDPEMKHGQSGIAILRLRIATSESWVKDGEKQEATEWHTVVMFGKRAEALGGILRKGWTVYVEGRIQTRSWEDKEGGKRYATEINVANLEILKGDSGGGGQRQQQQSTPASDPYAGGGGAGMDDDVPFAPAIWI